MLQIDILQHTLEFCALINRITESIGDVVIDVPIDASVVVLREVGSSPMASLTGTPSWLRRAAISVTAVAPDECPTKIIARVRPLLYSAAACSAKFGHAK